MPAVLFPRFDHPAIEERYASWQSQTLLRGRGDGGRLFDVVEDEFFRAAATIESDHVLVVTDPLLLPPAKLVTRLRELLVHTSSVVAALPVSNEAEYEAQRRAPIAPYLTLRELQQMTGEMQSNGADAEVVKWDGSDPGVYLCRTTFLEGIDDPPKHALAGRDVVISPADYVHRWSSLRGQTRTDLLARIPPTAKSILEFGCGAGGRQPAFPRLGFAEDGVFASGVDEPQPVGAGDSERRFGLFNFAAQPRP